MRKFCVVFREEPVSRDMVVEGANKIDALNRANMALKQVYGDYFTIETAWPIVSEEEMEEVSEKVLENDD